MATPTCPKCNATMMLRTKKGTSFQFYGCPRFPKCNGYLPYTQVKADRSNIVKPSNVKGSKEQIAIWDALVNDTRHIVIEAVAGSGKTFTIVYGCMDMLDRIKKTVKTLFVAFNRHIVKELETKLPQSIKVSTWHGYGLAAVKRWNPKVQIDEHKLDGIIDEYVNEDDNTDYIKGAIKRLVELCKYNLYDGKNRAQLDDLVLLHGIDLNDHVELVYTLVPQIIHTSKMRKNVIDFTDMLWFVAAHNIPVEQYDIVFADESQDFNTLQQYVAMLSIGSNGRIIAVGDRNQSIYGFAGADTNSIPNLIAKLENTNRSVVILPINMTRRCPVSHVDIAKQFVPHLESMPDAAIGSVEEMSIEAAIMAMKPGNMGICRRNAPLISVAYKLIRNDVPVLVKGRNFGDNLLSLIKKLKATTINDLISKAEQYRSKELEKYEARGKKAESAKQILNDKIDTLIALTEGMDDISEVKARIAKLFSDKDSNDVVTLSSVHRAKGLEADTLFILDHKRLMLPMSQDWAQIQERNLAYVAYTRGKDRMILVD